MRHGGGSEGVLIHQDSVTSLVPDSRALSMGCGEVEPGPDLAQLEEAGDQSSVGADRSKVNSHGHWAGR